jgi:hypothetical protein
MWERLVRCPGNKRHIETAGAIRRALRTQGPSTPVGITTLWNEFPGHYTGVVSQKFAYKLGKAFELPPGPKGHIFLTQAFGTAEAAP